MLDEQSNWVQDQKVPPRRRAAEAVLRSRACALQQCGLRRRPGTVPDLGVRGDLRQQTVGRRGPLAQGGRPASARCAEQPVSCGVPTEGSLTVFPGAPARQGTSRRMTPSRLLSTKICPCGPSPKRRSARAAGSFLLLDVLLDDELEQRLPRALVVEEDPADRRLAAVRQVVGVDVEDLAARVVAEDHQVLQLRDRGLPVDDEAGDRRRAGRADRDDRTRRSGRSAGLAALPAWCPPGPSRTGSWPPTCSSRDWRRP